MAINYELLNKGGISLGTNFELLSEKPLDSRLVVPSLDGLQNYIDNAAAYEGLIAYVSSEKKHYEVKVIDGVLSYRPFGLTEAELNDLITNATTAAMEFKGATATLPENPAKGDMYKVAGENINIKIDDVDAKLGDSIVYDGEKWFLIPSGDDIEDTWRPVDGVNNDATLKFVDGDKTVAAVAADGTIKYNHATVAAPTDVTAEGDEKTRTYITAVETDGYGHITGYKTATENVEDTNTEYTFESQVESSSVYFNVTPNTEGAAEETIYVDAYSKNEADGKFVAKETGKSLVSDDEIARLADVDNYDDEEVRGLIGDNADAIDELAEYVGTFTHDTAKTVVEYINAKTDGIATSGNLEALGQRVTAAEGEIDALQEASHTHTFADSDVEDAITKKHAHTFADTDVEDAISKKHSHTFVEAELNKIADGDVEKWNGAEENAKKYTDETVAALGLSSDDNNLAVTNKNVIVYGDITASKYEDDELGPQGGTIYAEAFYDTISGSALATATEVADALAAAKLYTDNLGTVNNNGAIIIDKDVYLYSKEVGTNEVAGGNLYIDDNKVATEVVVDDKIAALDLANNYQAKGDYATKPELEAVDAKFADYTKTSDLPTDLGGFTNNAGYAKTADVNTELDKKADKSQVATDIANAIAPLATTEALNGVKATAEAAVTDAKLATALEPYAKTADVSATYETKDDASSKLAEAKKYTDDAIAAIPAQTDYTVTITEATDGLDAGIAKKYTFTQNGAEIGTINLAKELVVTSGSVKEVTNADAPYAGAKVGDKYIELVIANQDAPIYVPAKDLVDIYTAKDMTGVEGAEVQVAISNTNEISATLVNGGITEEKLAEGVKTKLNKTWEEVGVAAGLVEGLENGQVKANKEAIEKLNGADTVDGSVAKSIKDAIEGENLGQYAKTADLGDLAALDTITADKVTDFATEVAKVKVAEAVKADEATKAVQDGNGKVIADTYAEKDTTLAGYGIGDAYTKTEIEALLTWGSF